MLGGPFLAPWDVPKLPGDLIDLLTAWSTELPGFIAARQRIEAHMQAWRDGLKTDKVH